MIRLQAGTILLETPDGGTEFLDLDRLHEEIWACCRKVGIDDPEMPDDIIGVITAFAGRQPRLTVSEVDALVLQILCDSGFRQLAEAFACQRPEAALPAGVKLVEPDEALVRDLLSREAFFVNKPVPAVAGMVLAHLDRLNFSRCTPAFLVELGRHLWLHRQAPAAAAGAAPYWLLPRAELPAIVPGDLRHWFDRAIVSASSVSFLFPAVRFEASLLQLARDLGGGPLLDLQFQPAFDELCIILPRLHQAIRAELRRRAPGVDEVSPPSVSFTGLKPLAAEHCGSSLRAEKALRESLAAIARGRLAGPAVEWEFA